MTTILSNGDPFTNAKRMLYKHEGPGHEISKDVDPETGERVLVRDCCQEVFYLTSVGFRDPGADEAARLTDLLRGESPPGCVL